MASRAPGVFVNQVSSNGPITGVGTSTPAFIGATNTAKPAVGVVNAYTNFTEFKKDFIDTATYAKDIGQRYLANAVYGFFMNGGTRCYVTRVQGPGSTPAVDGQGTTSTANDVVDQGKALGDEVKAAQEKAQDLGAALTTVAAVTVKDGDKTVVGPVNVGDLEKAKGSGDVVEVTTKGGGSQTLDQGTLKTMLTESVATIEKLVKDSQNLIKTSNQLANQVLASTPPAVPVGWDSVALTDALTALEPFDDISSVAAPGLTAKSQWQALVDHCASTASPDSPLYRFAILDAAPKSNWGQVNPIKDNLPDADGGYAALYYPWIYAADPIDNSQDTPLPPSGHVAGLYARVDAQQGVFKAPANESLIGALDLEFPTSPRQQVPLNDLGINCVRRINGSILVWGARTVKPADGDPFLYVSTRRLFNYICASLVQGTQWAVFEPNNPALWGRIIRSVTTFLTTIWQAGGLVGATQQEAFYVKCDEETNPPESRAQGNVVTEVGVAITKPAEFVIFNLSQISES